MHSFLIDMCRVCLTTNVCLKEYMVVEDKEIKCLDVVKLIFPSTVVPLHIEYAYSLCEVCINLLKCAVIFQRRLSESHNTYSKYMKILDFSNNYKISISISQHINEGYLSTIKTGQGRELKQTDNTCNQIFTNDTYFQDISNDVHLNFNTYSDFDNFPSELDTNIGKKQSIPVKTSQEEYQNINNTITDCIKKELLMADNDNCNQMDFNTTEYILDMRDVKEEQENLIPECINSFGKDIPMSDNDSSFQLDSKIDIVPWESETQCKNEILVNNLSTVHLKQEENPIINTEEKTSPILLTTNKVDHKHIHAGERSYKCDVCKKSFSKMTILTLHKFSHTGKRPHKCDVCVKSFPQKSHLVKHKRIHTGERSYKCDVCEKSFSTNSYLIVHKRIHTGERPYKYDVCEKCFSDNSYLTRHKRIHTGERLYKCDVCKESFSFLSTLIRHKRIHTGERPYKCDVCEKCFSDNSYLTRHKRIHTGERLYKYDVCKESFSFSSTLIRHKFTHKL